MPRLSQRATSTGLDAGPYQHVCRAWRHKPRILARRLKVTASAVLQGRAGPLRTAQASSIRDLQYSRSGSPGGNLSEAESEPHSGQARDQARPNGPYIYVSHPAKATNIARLTLAAGVLAVADCLTADRLMLPASGLNSAHGYALVSVAHDPTLRAAAGSIIYLILIALGIATAVRDTALSIRTVLAVLYLPRSSRKSSPTPCDATSNRSPQ